MQSALERAWLTSDHGFLGDLGDTSAGLPVVRGGWGILWKNVPSNPRNALFSITHLYRSMIQCISYPYHVQSGGQGKGMSNRGVQYIRGIP